MVDLTEQIKEMALNDKRLGLLDGKLGASIYFFVMSGHDETSDAFKAASNLLTQVLNGIATVRNIDLNNGLMGISLGISFLIENGYLNDASGRWQRFMDTYIYRVVVRAMNMELKEKEFASMVEILSYETWRYTSLAEGVEKQLHSRLINQMLNHIYMNRPADFYSEAMPFTVRDRLLLFILTLVEIHGMGIHVERIDRILSEMQPFLFSQHPILHPNRYCLFLASSLVAQATGKPAWKAYAESLRKSLDMAAVFTNDLYDMSVQLSSGVLGLAVLTWWYNRKSSIPVFIDQKSLTQRLELSTFWKRLSHDKKFMKEHYSLDGYCGIKLWLKTMEDN